MNQKYDANSTDDFEKFLRATGKVYYNMSKEQRKAAVKEFKAACN